MRGPPKKQPLASRGGLDSAGLSIAPSLRLPCSRPCPSELARRAAIGPRCPRARIERRKDGERQAGNRSRTDVRSMGAEDGAKLYAVRGPVEHQAGLAGSPVVHRLLQGRQGEKRDDGSRIRRGITRGNGPAGPDDARHAGFGRRAPFRRREHLPEDGDDLRKPIAFSTRSGGTAPLVRRVLESSARSD